MLCFTLYLRAISKYKPPGGLYLEGRFKGGFFALRVWGAYIWRGSFSEFYGIIAKLNRDALRCARVKKAFNISLPKGHYRDKNVQVYPFQTTVCTLSSKTLRIQGNLMAAAENEQTIRLSDLTIICEEKERKPLRHFSLRQLLFDMGARLGQW